MRRPLRRHPVAAEQVRHRGRHRRQRKRLRRTRVPAVAERRHQHRRGKRLLVVQPVPRPSLRVPVFQPRSGRGVEQRQQGGDRPAGRHLVAHVAGVQDNRGQHRAGHDRALRQAGGLQRAALRQVGIGGDDPRQMRRVLDEVDQRPPERCGQIGHRGDVNQRDVERDATHAGVGRLPDQASTIRLNSA